MNPTIILIKCRLFSDPQKSLLFFLLCRQSWQQTATGLPFAAVSYCPYRISHKWDETASALRTWFRSHRLLRTILPAYFSMRCHYRYWLLRWCFNRNLAVLELQCPALNAVLLGTMHMTVMLLLKMPWVWNLCPPPPSAGISGIKQTRKNRTFMINTMGTD